MPAMASGGGGSGRLPSAPRAPSPPRSRGAPPAHTDASSSRGDYGTRAANAFKQTPAYHQAVRAVFRAQAPQQKASVLAGLVKSPGRPEAQAVKAEWQRTPQTEKNVVLHYLGPMIPANGPSLADLIGQGLNTVAGALGSIRGATTPGSVTNEGSIGASIGTGPLAAKVAGNAAKDLVSLPGSALTTAATVGGHVMHGQFGKAANDVIDPYAQAVEHPKQAFENHPLLTGLMFTGLTHGASRLAAAPVRALANPEGAVGKALSTQREGVALTGKLTHERAQYSKSPTIKAQQHSVENALYTRAPTGELIPRSEQLRQHQLNQEIGQLVGTRERIRSVNRGIVRSEREQAVRPSVVARVGHAAKTALTYGPKSASVPGAEVLARIADGTIRRPDTIVADLQKHIEQVASTRPDLLGDPQALKAHDAYVKELQGALANKAFLKNPGRAFDAAAKYAKAYPVIEAQAMKLGHFGDLGAAQLERRALSHYAVSHMGAKFDEATQKLTGPAGEDLSNAAIREHMSGPNGTGGRELAYTPDRVAFNAEKAARAANYVSSERRPLPATARSTLYAYTHGLTRPGHEALTEQHVLMQGIVDAHHSQNAYLDTLATQKPGGGFWDTFQAAKRDAPRGYAPINVSQPFHPQASLDKALQGADPATLEEEAVRRSLDLKDRLAPGTQGRWAIIDEHALKALRQHENQIQPNVLLRSARGLNNQFRTVALSTSAKHIPGVVQENIIRDIAHGVGLRSWITGRRLLGSAEKMNAGKARELRTQLTGGQVAGMTEAGRTYAVSDHWAGTSVYPLLKAMEATFKAPGPRQLRTAWRTWTHFAIRGTKRLLEEQHQIAGLGKAALREHGYAEAAKANGFLGLAHRAFGLHGQMLDDAAKGLFDPAKARQMRAAIQQMYGRWTDLSPGAQTALMFSPFGLWWVNSARFLARMPIDQPVKTSLLASATEGTENQRKAEGLDMFAPGALPAYMQGGIPLGDGKVLAQNYYSPFGIANDPLATGQSLIQPWLTPVIAGSLGVNWLGKPLSSPGNPKGYKAATQAQRAQYIIDSALASFVPLYSKAEQIAAGGASRYDVSNKGVLPPLAIGKSPPTKTPGKGAAVGAKKAFFPFREYKSTSPAAAAGGWGGPTSSSAGEWGTPTGTSTGGWG